MSERGTEVTIERVVPGGDGLARVDGVVTLVEGGLPGDRVHIAVTSESTRLLRGALLEVLEPGNHRREDADVCPRARDGSCGGCDWPAVRLESHREMKTALVRDALRRLGRLEEREIPEPRWIGSARSYRLRNRLHVDGRSRVGFFGPRSNVVSDLLGCEIVSPELLARLPAVRDVLRDFGVSGELQTLESRDGELLLGELRPERAVSDPHTLARALGGTLDGIRIRDESGRNLATEGLTALDLVAGGVWFRVSVSSFFQGNRHLLDAFLQEAREAIRETGASGRAVDLYAGVGFLTRPLLESGFDTDAVEVDASSSADLAFNLKRWSQEGSRKARSRFLTAEAFLRAERGRFDLVVADPPRAGLSPEVRRALLRSAPPHLLLVSCDPATLARDLAALRSLYRIERLTLLDLFPGTHHVESLVRLVKT